MARYAKQHNIRIVRRADLSGQREAREETDPQAILKRMNQEIVYIERDELDITQEILERLTAPKGADAQTKTRAAGVIAR